MFRRLQDGVEIVLCVIIRSWYSRSGHSLGRSQHDFSFYAEGEFLKQEELYEDKRI